MLRGDFEHAWQISETILVHDNSASESQADRPLHLRSVWRGAPIEGKDLLIRCYHGLGDTIHFVRYCAIIHDRAGSVTLMAQPPLLELLKSARGIDKLLPHGSPDPEYDVDVELMELPFVLRTHLHSIPHPPRYLKSDPAGVEYWLKQIGANTFNIGLAWSVGRFKPERGLDLNLLSPLANLPGIRLFSLQRGEATNELEIPFALGPEAPKAITDTAALIENLDLVITVDTMVAHLAGALGKPVWTLLHSDHDWRWMRGREDSPWYPRMRLFRQSQPGDWPRVCARVIREVRAFQRASSRMEPIQP